jgi:hypothetical protein
MKTPSINPKRMNPQPRSSGGAPIGAVSPGSLAGPLGSDLSDLYALSQSSTYLFASPVGPFASGSHSVYLPRFVFFGPHACDESWRLAFLAGFDHGDLRASRALAALAARLTTDSDTGHALNLSFFPLVDIGGLVSGVVNRDLAHVHWGSSTAPEIVLLERDARQRGYHGFVRVETAPSDEELIVVRVRGSFAEVLFPGHELITSEETRGYPVRFESDGVSSSDGPLSIADDLPLPPFELTLRIPGSWSDDVYQRAAIALLERFLRRYRAYQAYGQHL